MMSNRAWSDKFYWLIVGVSPLLLIGLLAIGFMRDRAADSWVKAELARLTSEGIAIDDRTLTHAVSERTSKEHRQAWQEIVAASLHLESQWWPHAAQVAEIDAVVSKDTLWKADPFATDFADQGRPIVAMIQAIPDSAKPVWQPTLFDGFITLLPHLSGDRSVTRLLAREFRAAYHAGDTERAITAVDLMGRTQRLADAEHLLVSELVQIAIESHQEGLIRASLADDFWSDEQLNRLRQIRSQRKSLDQRWQDTIDDEQAMVMVNLDSRHEHTGSLGIQPHTLQLFLKFWRSLREIPNAGQVGHSVTAEQLLDDVIAGRGPWSALSITSLPTANATGTLALTTPSLKAFSSSFTRCYMQRNWTLCAIAIKQFKLRNKRFPTSLEELADVGLTRDQWLAVNPRSTTGTPFGYKVTDDHNTAILWTPSPFVGIWLDTAVTSVPPSELKEWQGKLDELSEMEIRIR